MVRYAYVFVDVENAKKFLSYIEKMFTSIEQPSQEFLKDEKNDSSELYLVKLEVPLFGPHMFFKEKADMYAGLLGGQEVK